MAKIGRVILYGLFIIPLVVVLNYVIEYFTGEPFGFEIKPPEWRDNER